MKCFLPLLFCLVFPVVVFTQDAAVKPKVLVVYYSRDGHTKKAAEALAKKFGADIEGLVDIKKRTGPVDSVAAGKDAVTHKLTRIAPVKADLDAYGIILIGTPSWFSNVTPAVRTFVSQNNFSGKKTGVFGTAHMTGVGSCMNDLAELVAPGKAGDIPRLPLVHKDLTEDILSKKIDEFYRKF
ncbi:MAG: flavodoxin [Candidatus Omnitrophica bacterium]|nr:flavodoxin [Candidatus Omnitrophota bacterium]